MPTAVQAVFWSPDSELLATLAFDSLGDGRDWVRWVVYDRSGEVVSQSPRFLVTPEFGGAYLPFFDQYAQSMTLWSPDSTRFVYPGESMAGRSGIWLHRLPTGDDPPKTFYVTDGSMAVWSP